MKNEIVGSITNMLETLISGIILLGKMIVVVALLFILMLFNNFFSQSNNSSMNTNKLKKFIRDHTGTTDDYE